MKKTNVKTQAEKKTDEETLHHENEKTKSKKKRVTKRKTKKDGERKSSERKSSNGITKARKDMNLPHRSKDQKCVVNKTKVNAKIRMGWGTTTYDPSYPQIAYDILSSEPFKTKSHLCKAFHCSKPTLIRWMRKYKLFLEAVECGLAAGEARFRDKAELKAWLPNKDVNNGLIQMLARNVYGIAKDSEIEINIGVGKEASTRTAEEEMQERGIPLPNLLVGDMDATIQTPLNAGVSPQGDTDNDRTEPNTPGQGNESIPGAFPIRDIHEPGQNNPTPGTQPQVSHSPGKQGEDLCRDGSPLEPGKERKTDESGTPDGLAGTSPSPLAGMDETTEPGSPTDLKKALKAKETTVIAQNLENERLRAQVRNLKIANANRIKEQSKRIVAGFGEDFASSDCDISNPYGELEG